MHLRQIFCAVVINVVATSAYFSKGWTPGAEPSTTAAKSIPSQGSGPASGNAGSPSPFDWTKLVSEGPIGSLFQLAGVNVTERLEQAKQAAAVPPFDERVPMITDENYEELILNPDSPSDETWFLVVTLGTSRDPASKPMDEAYDNAFNTTVYQKDLPNVKWGRIDYMTVTRLTTEWMIWKAPLLVVAREHGKELRFLYPSNIWINGDHFRKFLAERGWHEVPQWTGSFAPGGSMEPYVKVFARILASVYTVVSRVPKWLFLIGSGTVASFLIGLMHKSEASKPSTGASPAVTEKSPEGRPKRYAVKKASEVHPELSSSLMTSSVMSSSMMSDSDAGSGSRPKATTRRSTRKPKK
ncbi:hypothetical protein FRC14_006398 [Serendipita sp. 396]|nr:hypothetical protein FRC14_006398 [Serendipita sp. 396]KAG8786924.1 hypothetical protein FRC15_010417 [Serendipita sp. 397]KAG8802420.1 hypothetical protein FRC16_009699 [Serendipita sp. 398]KAG8822243.1 hypothetical protein FRC18_011075 [Serendipita sp. 400]KAG8858072.1 hypothetical protein FRB91_010461 [Serendipita sp. 411]KAG8871634.1 hypothetical protein FRC20_010354 [Serendipita sp. 405]